MDSSFHEPSGRLWRAITKSFQSNSNFCIGGISFHFS